MGGSSTGRSARQASSLGALHKVSSWGRRRVMSEGETREPASNVRVRRDNKQKAEKQRL